MSHVRLTRQAAADLGAISEYYAERSPDAGDRKLDEIQARCRLLTAQPGIGPLRDDLGTGVRSSVVYPYIIFHRPADGGTIILRVMHGSRDIGPDDFAELDAD